MLYSRWCRVNEGEFFEFLNGTVGVVMDTWATFITVFFAYVVCAYLVGRKISYIQSAALTLAYSVYTILQLLTVYFSLERIGEVGARYSEFYPDHERAAYFSVASVSLMSLIWFMSVVYMVNENMKREVRAV